MGKKTNTSVDNKNSATTKKAKKQVEEQVVEEKEQSSQEAIEEEEQEQEQQVEDDKSNQKPENIQRSIFISGLPYSVDDEQILEFFKNCGEIENVKLPRYQDTGKIIGYSHVTFKSVQGAQKALKLNKSTMGTRYLDIQLAKGEKQVEYRNDAKPPADCTTIFVKNIPFKTTEDEIGAFFEKCGKIENVRFVYHPHQKHFKGFAFVDFKMNSSVNAAIKMNGVEYQGRKLTIDFEVGSMKKGFRFKQNEEGNQKYNKQQNIDLFVNGIIIAKKNFSQKNRQQQGGQQNYKKENLKLFNKQKDN